MFLVIFQFSINAAWNICQIRQRYKIYKDHERAKTLKAWESLVMASQDHRLPWQRSRESMVILGDDHGSQARPFGKYGRTMAWTTIKPESKSMARNQTYGQEPMAHDTWTMVTIMVIRSPWSNPNTDHYGSQLANPITTQVQVLTSLPSNKSSIVSCLI